MLPIAMLPGAFLTALLLIGAVGAARAHGAVARPLTELPPAISPESVHPVHGDYDWIRRGGYKGVDGSSCCGRDDCDQVPAARLERTPEGYRLHDFGMTVPFRQVTPSEDGKFWLCRDGQSMRCFFAPPPGS